MHNKKGRVLIVDDNEEFLIALKILLSPHFMEVITELIPDRMLFHLKSHQFDVILLDMNFKAGIQSGNEGVYWMHKIREMDKEVTVLLITAFGDVDLAIRSLKEGATDFIQKSWDDNKIIATVLSAFRMSRKNREIGKLTTRQDHLKETIERDYVMVRGESVCMKEVYEVMEKVAVTEANIMISGESGTGKEVIAREIHRMSGRANALFVPVDLGTIQQNLFESELFGHAKGAFTDARSDKAGRIELASDGTLFLDEIGNLPLHLQPKLLTVIQRKVLRRLGENHERPVNFRLISATNREIPEMVRHNQFREDLLYRINTVEIGLPPLRNRIDDIPDLAIHFFNVYKGKYKKDGLLISDQVLNKMKKHSWPGNIRELQHAVEKAVILADGSRLQPADFQLDVRRKIDEATDVDFNLEKNEKEIIFKALETFEWNMSRTARELGINRSTLYDKIKKYELKPV